MKEHPILFNGEMVRAILEGRKTQTRRVIKKRVHGGIMHYDQNRSAEPYWWDDCGVVHKCPYGKPGDRLWVRETHIIATPTDPPSDKKDVWYRATPPAFLPVKSYPWRPSIHMPRWASRILLEVTDVRVERVQEITGKDARLEGAKRYSNNRLSNEQRYREGFAQLWERINAKRGFGWDKNPWVWVVEFKRIEP